MRKSARHPLSLLTGASILAALTPFAVAQFRPSADEETAKLPEVVVAATRDPIPAERAPSAVTVITAKEIEQQQYRFVSDALRSVPGLSVVQTGAPGQLTSVFVRGLTSDATQVLIDGLPINQGLAGLFNFADLATDNVERIEVVRGPQSTIYGPRAGGGVVNIVTKRGAAKLSGELTAEAGTFNTFRESGSISGRTGPVDFSAGVTRLDTEGDRRNSEYRATSAVVNLGLNPLENLRLGLLGTYSLADTGNPGPVYAERERDNLLTERWLLAPNVEFTPVEWWRHRLVFSYDEERQVNNPNEDGFVGATRALFQRYQLDYQNHLQPARWVTFTTGFFHSRVVAEQERPFVLFGAPLIGDRTENQAVFAQAQFEPIRNLLLVGSVRWDHFSQHGDITTYRFAGSYEFRKTGTVIRSSYATGFVPPSPQDKIFGNNFLLDPNETRGFDIGFEQPFWGDRVRIGANFFHNELTNIIGYDGFFNTLNLGEARTRGVEAFLTAQPVAGLTLQASYTYLDTEKTSSRDIAQPLGARLPRRPRNEFFASASYLWFDRLRTTLQVKHADGREELNFGAPNFDIEDYTTWRFAAEYEVTPNFKVVGRVENLFDEEYAEVFAFPNPGRAFYGGFNLRF
jgi:vitamin B12 transporter